MRVLSVFFAISALLFTSVCARPAFSGRNDGSVLVRRTDSRDPVLARRTDAHTFATAHETAAEHLDVAHHAHLDAAAAHNEAANAHLHAASRYPIEHPAAAYHFSQTAAHNVEAGSHHEQAQTIKYLANDHRDTAANAHAYGLPAHHEQLLQNAKSSSKLAHENYQHATDSGAIARAHAQRTRQS